MPGPQDLRVKVNEEFGRLLSGAINSVATYEGKTAPMVESELGQQIGLTVASIQRYKSGKVPPDARTIAIFAEAGVKRGFLNRRWLAKFLHVASYPSPDALLDQLCPGMVVEQTPERVLHNLPAPSYARFVMREQPYSEVLEALRQRTAVVVLSSFGGMGKTSLAREVAARCLAEQSDAPRFDGVVWVSDAERPGYTTLGTVLDEIAHTLGYGGFANYGHEEKRREVEQLLRRERVLVVVDNFETITDAVLLKWLLKLPEPSKALITTREYKREFRQGAWPVELRGMSEAESAEFITQRLQVLHMERMAGDHSQFVPLLEVTGGNPKAMEMALGCLKYERRPLQEVVDDLYTARGDLFEDLFHRSWALLDEAARRVLLSMTLFVTSVDPNALSVTADVRGSTFARALERLTDLAFLDVQQSDLDHAARYRLHPLVRAFANGELVKEKTFEAGARSRWLNWYLQLTSQVGYCRNDLSRLELLDSESGMLHVVADWVQHNQLHENMLTLANGCGFYCYVRGLMNREPDVNLAAAEAACALNRPQDELLWLAYHVQRMARTGNIAAAQHHLARMQTLKQTLAYEHAPGGDVGQTYHHSLASYYLALGQADEAEQVWRTLLAEQSAANLSRLVTLKWIATCLHEKGQLSDAHTLLEAALASAGPDANQRAVISLQLALVRVHLAEGNLEAAQALLADSRARVEQHSVQRHMPDIRLLEGYLLRQKGDLVGARHAFDAAIDQFERIGLRRELLEARRALTTP